MAETNSWAWHITQAWPGFDPANQNNLASRSNGLSINSRTLVPIRWRNVIGDGAAANTNPDAATSPLGKRVILDGVTYRVHEVAFSPRGTLVAAGTPYPVQFEIWLLDKGTCLLRLCDGLIPTDMLVATIDALTLGPQDGPDCATSPDLTDAYTCFVAGTMIHTVDGLLPVEELLPGDLVLTADHGFRPLQWSAQRCVAGVGAAAPVLIEAGTLGNSRDLRVAQQHRIMLSDWRANLLFGATEVLAAAQDLVNGHTIRTMPCDRVDYVSLMFDQHELVFSEGILTESSQPGDDGLFRMSQTARAGPKMLFPHQPLFSPHTARPCLRSWEVQALRSSQFSAR